MNINGPILDSMLAWHVLNSALPKGLGFITPFYAQDAPMWKHMSNADPAGYNCQDSDMTLRAWMGITRDLKANGLWEVFDRHVIQLDKVFQFMGDKGVLRDETLRSDAEKTLTEILAEIEIKMVQAVPMEARKIDHVYINEPKDTTGCLNRPGVRDVTNCPGCGAEKPRKDHFKVFKKKINPCGGLAPIEVSKHVTEYYRLRDWKLSVDQLTRYQKAKGHKPIIDRKEKKVTFNVDAVIRLQRQYKQDDLYPLILDYRESQKLLGTYVGVTDDKGIVRGGMDIGRDGRIHTLFTHNPSTLRSASQNPNLQNLPRPSKDPNALANLIRNLIVAGPGCIFTARDYSGIEAVLVGYFALSPRYMRLAKLDVHSFYTAYALYELEGGSRVKASDLPDTNWPDDRLIPHLAQLKKTYEADRNSLYKHLVHGANFMQGPAGAQKKIFTETGVEYPVSLVAKVMDIYFSLFPEIRKWHGTILEQAERDGHVRNPFGYVHRFYKPFEYEKIGGKWEKRPGPDANKVIAFLPQSTAAGIIKEAMLRLYQNRFEEAGQYLRLLVHDELFSECPEEEVDRVDAIMAYEMEQPIPQLALPSSYGMGESLGILTEAKRGKRWGEMKEKQQRGCLLIGKGDISRL